MPADQRLVGERALELPAAAGHEPRRTSRGRRRSASGPSRAIPGTSRRRPDDVDGQPLAGALLGEVEAVAVVEVHAQRERTLARLRRRGRQVLAPVQPAGPRQVDDEVQAGDVEVEELAVPAGTGDLEAAERAQRRVERLDRLDRGEVGPRQDAADGVLAQERGQRLHLGQLGHPTIIPEGGPPSRPGFRYRKPRPGARHDAAGAGGIVLPSSGASRRALVPAGPAARRPPGAARRTRLGRPRRDGPARLRVRRTALGAVRRPAPPLPPRLPRRARASRPAARWSCAPAIRPGWSRSWRRGRRGQRARRRRRRRRTAGGATTRSSERSATSRWCAPARPTPSPRAA